MKSKTLPTCILAAVILSLGGCGATVGTSARIDVSRFDNSRDVSIDPHAAWCGMRMTPCPMVGAQWNSAHPLDAFLNIEVIWEYTDIQSAEVNIDGRITRLLPSRYPTQFSNEDPGGTWGPMLRRSDKSFIVPLALINRMATADDVRIRIDTENGYDDAIIVSPGHDSKARHALQRFMAAVNQADAQAAGP